MSQQSTWIDLSYEGFIPKLIEVEKNSASDLYMKAVEWAKEYYTNYEEELILDNVDHQLKIRSTKSEAFHIGSKRSLYDLDYTLVLSFEDSKYTIEYEINNFFYNPSNPKYRAGGESQETGWDQKEFYRITETERFLDLDKSDGHSELTQTINDISSSLLEAMRKRNESQEQQNFAEINFIGYGGNRKVYLNDQLITTFGDSDIVKYKIHSKGRINVTILTAISRLDGVIEIKENKAYYFLAGNPETINEFRYSNQPIEQEVFEAFKESIEQRKKITYKVIAIEEDKNSPVGKIIKSENEGPKQGTCFLISKRGYLLTNYHVISGAETIHIKGIGNDFSTLYGVDIVAVDTDLDLALLRLKNQNITFETVPYGLNSETSSQGTKAFVLGYPLAKAMGEEIKVTEGIISAKSGYKGSLSQYQFSAAIQPGNSGSPLFDNKGNVVGVINAKLQGAESAGYAIKSQYVSTFLKLIENVQIENNQSSISSLTLPEKIVILKNNIFIVQTE